MRYTLILDGRTEAGGSPLIMHNERLNDPLDPITRELAKVTGKTKKTEVDHAEMGRIEFYGALYTDPAIPSVAELKSYEGAVVLPSWNIFRSLQEGAKQIKLGRAVLRGVVPLTEYVPLEYAGPESPVDLWNAGTFSLRKGVGIGTKKVMRTRPIFTDWQASLDIEVDPEMLDGDKLAECWRRAGLYAGLGDMRPVYGRYAAKVEVREAVAA